MSDEKNSGSQLLEQSLRANEIVDNVSLSGRVERR